MNWLAIALITGIATTAWADDKRRSGFDDMQASTQVLQKDPTQNPAMLWVREGAVAWDTPGRLAGQSCATCHVHAANSMRGVAARYPQFDATQERPINLQQRIDRCRTKHLQLPTRPPDDGQLLALESYIAKQSLGLPIAPPVDPRLEPWRERGRALFNQRSGQLDLSCGQCHEHNAAKKLGGRTIPQGHPTGYPIYRLEWQDIGSLQRRLRNCMVSVRAEPYAPGSAEFAALEVFLAGRAAGMPSEAPAVRP